MKQKPEAGQRFQSEGYVEHRRLVLVPHQSPKQQPIPSSGSDDWLGGRASTALTSECGAWQLPNPETKVHFEITGATIRI